MESSQKSEVPNQISRENDAVINIPEEWKDIAFQDFFANGWKPRIKTTRGIAYITLRRGNNEKSLGPYDEDRWHLVMSMFPKKAPPPPSSQSKVLLSTKLTKPQALKGSIEPSLEALNWYQWAQNKGYTGSLGDFINDVIHTYFQDQGLELIVVIPKGEIQNGN